MAFFLSACTIITRCVIIKYNLNIWHISLQHLKNVLFPRESCELLSSNELWLQRKVFLRINIHKLCNFLTQNVQAGGFQGAANRTSALLTVPCLSNCSPQPPSHSTSSSLSHTWKVRPVWAPRSKTGTVELAGLLPVFIWSFVQLLFMLTIQYNYEHTPNL